MRQRVASTSWVWVLLGLAWVVGLWTAGGAGRIANIAAFLGAPMLLLFGLLAELAHAAPRQRDRAWWRAPLAAVIVAVALLSALGIDSPQELRWRWFSSSPAKVFLALSAPIAFVFVRFERARDGAGMARVAITLWGLCVVCGRDVVCSSNCFGPITPAYAAAWGIAEIGSNRITIAVVGAVLLTWALVVERSRAKRGALGAILLLACGRVAQEWVTSTVAVEVGTGEATRPFVEYWDSIASAIDYASVAMAGAWIAAMWCSARVSGSTQRSAAWAIAPPALVLVLLASPALFPSMTATTVQQNPEPIWQDIPELAPIEMPRSASGAYLFTQGESSVAGVLDPEGPLHVYRGGRTRELQAGEGIELAGRLFWGSSVEVIFDQAATLADARRVLAAAHRYPGIRITGYQNQLHGAAAATQDRWPFVARAARGMAGVGLHHAHTVEPDECVTEGVLIDGHVVARGGCDRISRMSVDRLPDETPLALLLERRDLVATVAPAPGPLVRTHQPRPPSGDRFAPIPGLERMALGFCLGVLAIALAFALWAAGLLFRFRLITRHASCRLASPDDDVPIWPSWLPPEDATHRWERADARAGPYRASNHVQFRGPASVAHALRLLLRLARRR